jgi:peptidoglycan/xylan/chitin deacetylase (PgdA/CDA1 family)
LKVTIVMYHYVRDLKRSRFPEIKGLELDLFREQIRYFKKHYALISGDELLRAVSAGETPPPRALLLTFDDGYLDHFTNVFPILDRERAPACFFAPAKCILDDRVLDVNKIHFVLAATENKREIIDHIFRLAKARDSSFDQAHLDHCWNKLAKASRFDPKEVVFIKRFLQREMPEAHRAAVVDSLFRRYVTSDEASFARELYMSVEQLDTLRRHGMHIGSHGYRHCWLNSVDESAQRDEVERSLAFLRQVGSSTGEWMMCYPYGGYDDSLLSILRESGCKVGLTTRVGVADLGLDDHLTLPRLDTNDLPTSAAARPVE